MCAGLCSPNQAAPAEVSALDSPHLVRENRDSSKHNSEFRAYRICLIVHQDPITVDAMVQVLEA